MSGMRPGRAAWMGDLARGFRDYLMDQTEIDLVAIEDEAAELATALERLDFALAQLADLASVYGDDTRGVLDPLIVPAAALAGEYLRGLAGAAWVEPDPEMPPDDALAVALRPGMEIDMHIVTRAALGGVGPRLGAALVARLEVLESE